jgi:hypothetical protein
MGWAFVFQDKIRIGVSDVLLEIKG